MTTYLGKELFIRFTASAFRKLPSIYVFSYFSFGFEGRMWDLVVSVPDHCLSFYFDPLTKEKKTRSSCISTNRNNFISGLKFVSMNAIEGRSDCLWNGSSGQIYKGLATEKTKADKNEEIIYRCKWLRQMTEVLETKAICQDFSSECPAAANKREYRSWRGFRSYKTGLFFCCLSGVTPVVLILIRQNIIVIHNLSQRT